MSRLPQPGGDEGDWGTILNDFLEVTHNADGSLMQSAITNAGGYVKPGSGIPATDMATAVQTSLTEAGSAVQNVNGMTGNTVTLTASTVSAQSLNTITATQTSAYTASPWQIVLCDASAGSFTVTLPSATALAGQQVVVKLLTTAIGNVVTVQIAGSDVINASGTTAVTLKLAAESFQFTSNGTGIWVLDGGQKSLGSLQTIFTQATPPPVVNWGQANPVVTHFQSGHGWTANAFASSNLNDTSDYIHGSQVITGNTVGNSGTFATFTKTGMTAFSMSGQMLRVWVKCDNPTNLSAITLRVAGTGGIAGNNYLNWTVQQSTFDATNQYWCPAGTWVPMTLSMANVFTVGSPATTALTEARLIVQDNGTAATVHFAGIDAYPSAPPKWPNGVVTICFDDSYVGQFSLARPVMAQYGYRATMFPIWDQVGSGASFMTMANMHLLHDELGWEVAPHASTLSNHGSFGSLTPTQIQSDIAASLSIQQQNGFGYSGAYAYPLGYFSGGQDETVSPFVKVARTINHTQYAETLPVGQKLRLRSAAGVGGLGGVGVTTFTTASTGVFALTKANPAWIIITIHDVSSGTSTQINQISIADFTTLISSINSQGLAVATMGEVLASGAFGL